MLRCGAAFWACALAITAWNVPPPNLALTVLKCPMKPLFEPTASTTKASSVPSISFAAQIGALLTHDCTARLAAITTPALLASHDDIIITPALSRALFEALPAADWALLPGGHAAFLEDPPAWNRTVIDFIAAHR